MARASGPAMEGLMQGRFLHAASGVQYRIFRRDGAGWLSYARPAVAPGGYLNGEVKLAYFIGSNTRGRTYLFARDGYWFETPVNWYAKKHVWDMAPNYLNAHEMPLTLPVDANCLHCHVSGVAVALPGRGIILRMHRLRMAELDAHRTMAMRASTCARKGRQQC